MTQLHWRKSSYSNETGGECLEARLSPGTGIDVRDTQHRHLGLLQIPATEWRAFITAVHTEELP